MSTVSWNTNIPKSIDFGFKTFIKRKVEYRDGQFAYFTFCHSWCSGEEMLVEPSWVEGRKHREFGHIRYDKENLFQKETFEYFEQHAYDVYRKDDTVKRGNFAFRHDNKYKNELKTVKIGEKVERIVFDELDGYFVIRYFEFFCNAPALGDIKGFLEYKRVFIVDGVIWTEYRDNPEEKYFWKECHYKKALNSLLHFKRNVIHIPNHNVLTTMQRNLPNCFIPNRYMKWFSLMPTMPNNSKFQKKINQYSELISDEIPNVVLNFFLEIGDNNMQNRCSDFCFEEWENDRYCHSQRLSENIVVLRLFEKSVNGVWEYARLFVDDERVYPCYCHCGQVSRCESKDSTFWTSKNKTNVSIKGTVLEKRLPYLENRNTDELPLQIIYGMEYILIEQMEKLGFHKYCNAFYSVKRLDTRMFMKNPTEMSKKKSATIFDVYSKSELKRLVLFKRFIKTKDNSNLLLELFNNSGIENIDFYKQFAKNLRQEDFDDFFKYYVHCLVYIGARVRGKQMTIVANKIWTQFIEVKNKHGKRSYVSHELIRMLRDTYNMLDKVYCDDVAYYRDIIAVSKMVEEQDIRSKHDTISCLAKYNQYPKERFDIICKRHKSKEYENEQFLIRLPEDTDEIITEGSKMNHCVGSYIDSVMDGNSIIFFMRKKELPDKPYVTIELGKNGELYQVKCNSNRYLASETALDFLTNWAKAKKIKPTTHDVLWEKGHFVRTKSPHTGYYLEEDVAV